MGDINQVTAIRDSQWLSLPRLIVLSVIGILIIVLYLLRAQIPVGEWYSLLSVLAATLTAPISDAANGLNIPFVSALLFGLIGAIAPCQLTTNASALAFLTSQSSNRGTIGRSTLAYILGKALVYTLVGVVVILAGRQLAQKSIPVIVVARKVLGPFMIVLGLYLLRLVPLRFSLGQGVSDWLEARAGKGVGGAFLLGIAFSLAMCPTLFLLFFGLTIPMALSSPVGVLFPAVFAVGTTLPLLLLASFLAAGMGATRGYIAGARRLDTWLRPIAGLIFLLAGLNDFVIYWFL